MLHNRNIGAPPRKRGQVRHGKTVSPPDLWRNRKLRYRDSVSWRRGGPDDWGKGLVALVASEREAISLASELQAILLLMDERDGVI
jgi:hypothetical protein